MPQNPYDPGHETILICDDDQACADTLTAILKRDYRVSRCRAARRRSGCSRAKTSI